MTPNPSLQALFDAQRAAFAREPLPDAATRRERLRALRRQLQRWQDRLAGAMNRDFGCRSFDESKMLDLLGTVLDIDHTLARLRRWMKPVRRQPELLFFGNRLRVHYQPKGVVGVIVPWNFPIYLALGPLVAALAAGNRVMLKMSEATPATNAALRALLAEVFDSDLVALVGEELQDPNAFTALPFDHIVFTGSAHVGRVVMRTAAQNLTPVTLELGGKSPALVTRNFPVDDAARRIAHGKWSNAGQVCVSPDYALVPREQAAAFIDGVKAAYARFSGDGAWAGHTAIVNDRQWQRLQALLDDARAKGASIEIFPPAAAADAAAQRQMPLHIITGARADMRVMQEELFGPILPVLPYDTLDEALACINAQPRPLALYCFTTDSAERDAVLARTHSGGVTINDWCWHVVNHDAPFGGIGASGMGSYHGIEGFRELSHARTVFEMRRWFPIGLFHPPYGRWAQRLVLRWKLGSADPQAGQGGEPPVQGA
jgi:coniferyl-aldehyde dehydrogenase